METTREKYKIQFQLTPSTKGRRFSGSVISKKRILIGRAESCDFVIDSPSVSAIHAVLEIIGVDAKIYDMNSTNGTFLNGRKVVTEKISIGDKLGFADTEFVFEEFKKTSTVPPVLNMLSPKGIPLPIEKERLGPAPEQPKALPGLPKTPVEALVPRIMYPLAQDPKAEFSEYIFEDVEFLYPIFDYETSHGSVEVIILYEGRIFSIDYVPEKKGIYYLVGSSPKGEQIGYPYLGKKEKFPFVEVSGNEIFVSRPLGYNVVCLSDIDPLMQKQEKKDGPIHLGPNDIILFQKEKCQIFVRATDAPPKVASAPLLRRDALLKKLLLLAIFFCLIAFTWIQTFHVDSELEKEKIPDRVATIIYKKELREKPKPTPLPEVVKKEVPKPVEKVEPKKPEPAPKPEPTQVPEPVKPIVKKEETPKEKPKETPKEKPKAAVAEKVAPKKGNPPKAAKDSSQVAQKGKAGTPAQKPGATQGFKRPRFSPVESASPGHVDTYKADSNLSATVNSFLAKGGSKAGIKSGSSATGGDDALGAQGVEFGDSETKGLKRAQVSSNIGSLTGAAQGKLVDSTGAQGLVDKRGVYTAGIPTQTVVLGAMDPDIIRQILRDHIPQFRHCYQKELDQSNNDVAGVIELNFTIGASGHVTNAGVGHKTNLPSPVKGCVINVLRGIKFPEPLGGGTVEVKQPMNFYPVRN